MDFNFYVIVPQYLAIPKMWTIQKFLSVYKLKNKMQILIFFQIFTFFGVYSIAILAQPTEVSFWATLLLYSVTYSIANVLTGFFVCICTKYTPDHMVLFYFCQPGVNCIINAFKLSFLWLKIDFLLKNDFDFFGVFF